MDEHKVDKLLLAVRAALLMAVDAIEVYRGQERTKDMRARVRKLNIGGSDNISGAVYEPPV